MAGKVKLTDLLNKPTTVKLTDLLEKKKNVATPLSPSSTEVSVSENISQESTEPVKQDTPPLDYQWSGGIEQPVIQPSQADLQKSIVEPEVYRSEQTDKLRNKAAEKLDEVIKNYSELKSEQKVVDFAADHPEVQQLNDIEAQIMSMGENPSDIAAYNSLVEQRNAILETDVAQKNIWDKAPQFEAKKPSDFDTMSDYVAYQNEVKNQFSSFHKKKKDFEEVAPKFTSTKLKDVLTTGQGAVANQQELLSKIKTGQQEADESIKAAQELNKDKLNKLGFFEGFAEGMEQTTLTNTLADMYIKGDEEELQKALENIYTDQLVFPKETTTGGTVGELLGGQVKPLAVGVGGAAASQVATGNPLLGIGIGAAYYGRMGLGSGLMDGYTTARSQGKTQTEAFEIAKQQSKAGAIGGVAEGTVAAIPFLGKPLSKIATSTFKNAVTSALKDNALDAVVAGVSQYAQNKNLAKLGLSVEDSRGVAENMAAEMILGAGMNLAFYGGSKINPEDYNNIITGLAKLPFEDIQLKVDEAVKAGVLDASRAGVVLNDIAQTNTALQSMPQDISEEVEAEVLPKVKEINRLEEENKNVVDAFKEVNNEKIAALNEEVKNIIQPKEEENAEEQQSGSLRNEGEQNETEGQRDSDLPSINENELQDREETAPIRFSPYNKPTKEKPYVSSNGKYNVYQNETGEIIVESKDGSEFSRETKRVYTREFKDNYQYDTGKYFEGEANSPEEIIDNSINPSEIAELIQSEPRHIPEDALDYRQRAIANNIGRVKTSDYIAITGNKGEDITDQVKRAYLSNDGASLDIIAMEAEMEAYGDYDAENPRIEPQDVVDFMEAYDTPEHFWKQKNPVYDKAAKRFKELTGFDLDSKTIKLASDEKAKRKGAEGLREDKGTVDARTPQSERGSSEATPKTVSKQRPSLEDRVDAINQTKEKSRTPAAKELTKAQKAIQKFNEKLEKAKALRDAQNKNLGAIKDPIKEAEELAKADREVFDAAVEVAKEYIKETADKALHTLEDFAKYIGQKAEEVKAAWEAATKEPEEIKKTITTKRAYEGEFREGVKSELEKLGLTRDVESQKEAKAKAIEFVDSIGEETALEAVRNNDVSDAAGAYVWNELIERNDRRLSSESNPDKIAELQKQQAQLIDELSRKALSGGRFSSALGDIYENSDLGYNVEKKIADYKKENNGEIPAEVEAKFRELDNQLQEVKKQLAEAEERAKKAEEQLAVDNIKESVEREKKSKTYTARAKRAADEIRKLKSKPIELRDENGNIIDLTTLGVTWNDIVEAVAKTVEAGGKVADAINAALKDAEWYSKLTDKGKEAVQKQLLERFNVEESKFGISHQMIRDLVESGVNDIESLVREIKSEFPSKTEREIRDAITGYGRTVNPNKEEIEVAIRKMKRIGRDISKLEDLAEGKRPLRSGAQRDKIDAEERALQKQVREAMKELPIDEADLEAELKTQLDAAKQRIQNQIEDLQREIDKKELTPKNPKVLTEDAELKSLKEKRDALKAEHEKIFKDEAFKERRRLELTKKATQRSIEDLQKRMKEGDFSKRTKKPLLSDSELVKLRAEKIRIKEEYDKEFYKAKLKSRTKFEKAIDLLWDAWGLTRLLRATGEFSFVGIQGLINTISHPLQAKEAFKRALKSFASPEKTEKWLREIKAQEWYPVAKQSKLALTEPHAELTAREELFYSDWTDAVWNTLGYPFKLKSEKAYDNWKKLNPAKAFERAAVGYLDTLRIERFLDGMEMLKEQGKTFENSPQDYKDVADAINTFTGRASLGKAELIAPQLAKIFFSPRNWASAIKTATPYGLYHFGKMTPTARKMAISDFSKFVGLTTSMVGLAAIYLNNDEDETTSVELDPRSSDFGKIKTGDTRVDPWGGRIQQIVFQARLISDVLHDFFPEHFEGGIKKQDGSVLPLGMPNKTPTKLDVAEKMAINKLAPSAAIFERYMNTHYKKADGEMAKVDEYGNPYSLKQELKDNLYPIYWSTLSDLIKEDPNALNGLLAFYAFFGGGVNVYTDKKPDKTLGSKMQPLPLNSRLTSPNGQVRLNQIQNLPLK